MIFFGKECNERFGLFDLIDLFNLLGNWGDNNLRLVNHFPHDKTDNCQKYNEKECVSFICFTMCMHARVFHE